MGELLRNVERDTVVLHDASTSYANIAIGTFHHSSTTRRATSLARSTLTDWKTSGRSSSE